MRRTTVAQSVPPPQRQGVERWVASALNTPSRAGRFLAQAAALEAATGGALARRVREMAAEQTSVSCKASVCGDDNLITDQTST